MKVFNLFFKLAKKYRVQIFSSILMIVLLSIPIKNDLASNMNTKFEPSEMTISIMDYDQQPLSKELTKYLESKTNVVDIKDTPEKRIDALFFKKTQYILEIPEGWSQSVLSGGKILPFKSQVGESSEASINMDTLLTTYVKGLEISRLSLKDENDIDSIKVMTNRVNQEIEGQVKVNTSQESMKSDIFAFGEYYQSFSFYGYIMTFITVFGNIILAMRSPEVSKREWLGKTTEAKRTLQSWTASVVFGILMWIIYTLIGLIIFGFDIFSDSKGQLMLVSSLITMLGLQSMCYFIAVLVPNKGMVGFLSTLISLIVAFFSGLFVPLELVNKTVQSIVSIATPIWYMKNNHLITDMEQITSAQLQPVFINWGIQLLLMFAYVAMSYMVQRHRLIHRVYLD